MNADEIRNPACDERVANDIAVKFLTREAAKAALCDPAQLHGEVEHYTEKTSCGLTEEG